MRRYRILMNQYGQYKIQRRSLFVLWANCYRQTGHDWWELMTFQDYGDAIAAMHKMIERDQVKKIRWSVLPMTGGPSEKEARR